MQIRDAAIGTRAGSWPEPGIACVWLPQLSLRMEVLRHPDLDGRPLVLGNAPGERRLVQLCSPEAERAGIRPGLPLREVLPLCRDAIILQPDPVRVATLLEEISAKLQRVSPAVELQDDAFFLDLHGLRAIYHADQRALEGAVRAVVPRLLRPRIGMAAGRFTAWVAAHVAPAAGARVVDVAEIRAFLAPLSIRYLPFAPEALQRLDLLGLRTIGDLAALPFAAVQAEFGRAGASAWSLANGRDAEPVLPRRFSQTVRAALSFDDPLSSVEAVSVALHHLLARAYSSPALEGRAVRQMRLRALLSDGTSWERLITFKEILLSRDAAASALKSWLQLANSLPAAPIEELTLELLGFDKEGATQSQLFSIHARQRGPIAEAVRQLRARYGRESLYHAVEVEPWSRIPERRWALTPCDL